MPTFSSGTVDLREQVREWVSQAVSQAMAEGALALDELPNIVIDRARDPSHGDFACPVALGLAKTLRAKPRDIATTIAGFLQSNPLLERAEIAGPGFINLYLSPAAHHALVDAVRVQRDGFGRSQVGKGQRVQVEFVSSNPTGPLHVGHGRGAAYGAAVADILAAVGYDVEREYYVNDAGRQMSILTVSVWMRYLELCGETLPFPSNGYQGDYIFDIAADIHREQGDVYRHSASAILDGLPADEADGGDKEIYIDALSERAKSLVGKDAFRAIFDVTLAVIRGDIEKDLAGFGVVFQNWFSELSLVEGGAVEAAVERLRKAGHLYEDGGALWFRSTDFGDEKDRVVVRDNGVGTYFASDIAYHLNKLERGFDRCINVWGADHHGYIPRVKGSLAAAGEESERLEVLIVQFANLFRGEEKVSMSTRSGEFVTLRELREEVGKDAARFFYSMRKNDQHLDFDLELAKSESKDNPVYYVQYAHARVCSMFARAQERGLSTPQANGTDLTPLEESDERDLMLMLSRYPEVVESAAQDAAPHLIAHYVRELAGSLHQYYDKHKILVDDDALRIARMALTDAVRIVIANGLGLLGVSAPEKM